MAQKNIENNDVSIETGDLEIGAVELKDATTSTRLAIDAANTARTTATIVLPIQNVDATGKVSPAGDAVGNAPFTKITDGTNTAAIDDANTARTTGTIVQAVQHVDATGKVQPAGELVGNGIFTKISDGTTVPVVETTGTKKALNVNLTDGTNDMPTGDAVARSVYTAIGDGTTTAVVETAGTKKALNVNVSDGTNDMPTMDANTRSGFMKLTNGTNEVDVLTGSGDGTSTSNNPVVTESTLKVYDAKATDLNMARGNANGILKAINSFQVAGGSVYIVGIQKGTYTVNNGSWNIDYTGFTGLTVENFPFGIINLTTDQIYNVTNATITSTQIQLDSTFNSGTTATATGNLLFIPIVQDVRAYDDSNDATKVIEQSPLDQQVLEETLLSAVAAATTSSAVYVLDKKDLTIESIVTSGATGATFKVQGSNDNSNWVDLGFVNPSGTVATSAVQTTGNYMYEVVNASSVKYVRVDLSSYTNGTFTVILTGRA